MSTFTTIKKDINSVFIAYAKIRTRIDEIHLQLL